MQRGISKINITEKKFEERNMFSKKGFVLSLEAGLSIMIFAVLIMALPQPNAESTKELLAIQQANDLLKVWSATSALENEMIKDTKEFFGNNAELWINERKIVESVQKSKAIATEGILIDDLLSENRVRIIVYFN